MRLTSWVVVLIAVLAVSGHPEAPVSVSHSTARVSPPDRDFQVNQEIKNASRPDLSGRKQLIRRLQFEKLPPGSNATQSELQTQAINVIERRINAVGVSEPVVQGLGTDKILLELPGVTDIQQANDVATRQAFLEIKVPDKDKPGEYVSLQPPLTGADLNPNGVYVTFEGTRPVVHFSFPGEAGNRWIQISKDYLQQPVQITLDGQEISAPVIQTIFSSGDGIIEGNFTTRRRTTS